MHHQIDVGGEFFFFRCVAQPNLHEAVFGADVEIGQKADTGFGGDARLDEVEVVAGEDDSAPGELFRLPQPCAPAMFRQRKACCSRGRFFR